MPKVVAEAKRHGYTQNVGRALKRQVQQELRWPNKAGDLRGRKREARPRGTARIGRPKKPGAGVPHTRRPALKSREPLLVTIRADEVIGRLRTRSMYGAIREAAIVVLKHEAFRIIHMSIEGTHIHLIVEVDDRRALSRGMQAFQISAAKHINAAFSKAGGWWERKQAAARARRRGAAAAQAARALDNGHAAHSSAYLPARRRGSVFPDRYHETVITNPRQARHALAYVLNNWRRHREDRAAFARGWMIDPFATGWVFDGWKERAHTPFVWKTRETYQPIPVWIPKTWLLREGWRMYGLIGVREVPGPKSGARDPMLVD